MGTFSSDIFELPHLRQAMLEGVRLFVEWPNRLQLQNQLLTLHTALVLVHSLPKLGSGLRMKGIVRAIHGF